MYPSGIIALLISDLKDYIRAHTITGLHMEQVCIIYKKNKVVTLDGCSSTFMLHCNQEVVDSAGGVFDPIVSSAVAVFEHVNCGLAEILSRQITVITE